MFVYFAPSQPDRIDGGYPMPTTNVPGTELDFRNGMPSTVLITKSLPHSRLTVRATLGFQGGVFPFGWT